MVAGIVDTSNVAQSCRIEKRNGKKAKSNNGRRIRCATVIHLCRAYFIFLISSLPIIINNDDDDDVGRI